MNKKVKSLLVAGLLVVGMTGFAFADGNGNDGCYLGGGNGQHKTTGQSNEHKVENITKEQWESYVATYNKANESKGYTLVLQSENNGNGYHTWKVMKDGKQVEVVHVRYNKVLTEEEKAKKQKPVTPDIPGSEQETGDASMLMTVGGVALSAVALYVLRDKKDEE